MAVDGEWDCPRWFPDGDRIVAFDVSKMRLAIIDLRSETTTPVVLPDGVDEANCADPSPDGSRLAVALDAPAPPHYEIWSLDVDGIDAERLGRVPERCSSNFVAWAPTGEGVAVDAICREQENSGIWLISTDGAAPKQLIGENEPGTELSEGLQYWAPSWIADDSVVFYRVPTTGSAQSQIWSADLTGHVEPLIETDAYFPAAPPP